MFAAPANPGCVDESEGPVVALIKNVDGVPCCAGQLAYNRTFVVDDRVDQRRFTYVGPTDDGDGQWMFDVRSAFADATADKCLMFDLFPLPSPISARERRVMLSIGPQCLFASRNIERFA